MDKAKEASPKSPSRSPLGSLDPANLVARALRNTLDGTVDSHGVIVPSETRSNRIRIFAVALLLGISLLGAALLWWFLSASAAKQPPLTPATEVARPARNAPIATKQPVPRNVESAQPEAQEQEGLQSLQKSAGAGEPEAQFQLGNRYSEGDGVPLDRGMAVAWWRQAAEQGHLMADVNLGILYRMGYIEHVPVDWNRVGQVFLEKAEAGVTFYNPIMRQVDFQMILAGCYRNGCGVPGDPGKAVYWFTRVAERGDNGAMYYLAEMFKGDRGLPRDEAKVFYWIEKSAQKGGFQAQCELAEMYLEGKGAPRNPEAAAYWAHRAAEGYGAVGGDGMPQALLARMYHEGLGVEKDTANAVALCHKGIELGSIEAQQLLDKILRRNNEAVRKSPESFEELLQAAEAGLATAQYQVAKLYLMGKGTHRDGKKGFYWMEKAAQAGNAIAAEKTAEMYAAGIYVARNFTQAAAWKDKAKRLTASRPSAPVLDKARPEFYGTR